MQTLIYALRAQTTKVNARALFEYFDCHSEAHALFANPTGKRLHT